MKNLTYKVISTENKKPHKHSANGRSLKVPSPTVVRRIHPKSLAQILADCLTIPVSEYAEKLKALYLDDLKFLRYNYPIEAEYNEELKKWIEDQKAFITERTGPYQLNISRYLYDGILNAMGEAINTKENDVCDTFRAVFALYHDGGEVKYRVHYVSNKIESYSIGVIASSASVGREDVLVSFPYLLTELEGAVKMLALSQVIKEANQEEVIEEIPQAPSIKTPNRLVSYDRIPVPEGKRDKLKAAFMKLAEANILSEEDVIYWLSADFEGFPPTGEQRILEPATQQNVITYFIKQVCYESGGGKSRVSLYRDMLKRRISLYKNISDASLQSHFSKSIPAKYPHKLAILP